MSSWKSGARALVAACALMCGQAYAQSTPVVSLALSSPEVHTVAVSTIGVPVEHNVTIPSQGTYTVTLTDIGATLKNPAPLANVELAVTSGSNVVGTTLTAAGSMQFSGSPGTYIIHVVGSPGTGAGSGPIGIQVTDAQNNVVGSFSDTLAPPASSIPAYDGALDETFQVSSSGSYQLTLSDLGFPQVLTAVAVTVLDSTGALVANLAAAGSTNVSLSAGMTYTIIAAGTATGPSGGGANAGLYGVNISPTAGGAAVYSKSVPIGAVSLLSTVTLTAATYTLTVADLKYPNALTSVGAAMVLDGRAVSNGQVTSASQTQFVGTANSYQVFAVGLTSSSAASYPGTGSYSVELVASSGTSALSVARAVSDPSVAGFNAYSFDTTAVGSEAYSLDFADFSYPGAFASVAATVAQNGATLGTPLTSAGTATVTPGAGAVSLLVFAKPTTTAAAGLFGIDWIANGAGTATFETTQAVGQAFASRKVTLSTGGNYQVTVADVGFPAKFASLAVLVTRGSSISGSIFGGGSFTFNAPSAGDYYLSFVAQPSGTSTGTQTVSGAGTYAITVATAPPAPTVTLQINAVSVSSGGTVTLQWSSTNANTCSLSGSSFSNTSEPTTGSATSAALTAATTFTLTCTGPGGSTPQSVTVNISSSSSGGHGGGSLGMDLLALLFGLVSLRAHRRYESLQ